MKYFQRTRLDHGPMFVCVNIGLLLGAIYILSHWNTPTPIFAWLTLGTENTMAVVQVIGCLGVIFGQLSGTKVFRSGADLRNCYDVVKWSCFPTGVSLTVFEIGLWITQLNMIPPVIHPLSELNILVMSVIVGLFFVATELNFETQRLTRELNKRIELMIE